MVIASFAALVAFRVSSLALIAGRVRFASGAIHRKKLVGAVLQSLFIIGHFVTECSEQFIGAVEVVIFAVNKLACTCRPIPFRAPIALTTTVRRIKSNRQKNLFRLGIVSVEHFQGIFQFRIFLNLLIQTDAEQP